MLTAKEIADILGKAQVMSATWNVQGGFLFQSGGQTLSVTDTDGIQLQNLYGKAELHLPISGPPFLFGMTSIAINPTAIVHIGEGDVHQISSPVGLLAASALACFSEGRVQNGPNQGVGFYLNQKFSTTGVALAGEAVTYINHSSGSVVDGRGFSVELQQLGSTLTLGTGLKAALKLGATCTDSRGLHSRTEVNAGAVTTAYGQYIDIETLLVGSITTAYGQYTKFYNNSANFDTAYGLKVEFAGTIVAKWGFHIADEDAQSYLGGYLGIGESNPAAHALLTVKAPDSAHTDTHTDTAYVDTHGDVAHADYTDTSGVFGYTTIGGNVYGQANYSARPKGATFLAAYYVCPGVSGQTVTVTGLYAYCQAASTAHLRLAIYTTASAFVTQGSAEFQPGTTGAWQGHTAFVNQGGSSMTPTLTAGNTYWIVYSSDSVAAKVYYAVGSAGDEGYLAVDYTGGFPTTLPSFTDYTSKWNLKCTATLHTDTHTDTHSDTAYVDVPHADIPAEYQTPGVLVQHNGTGIVICNAAATKYVSLGTYSANNSPFLLFNALHSIDTDLLRNDPSGNAGMSMIYDGAALTIRKNKSASVNAEFNETFQLLKIGRGLGIPSMTTSERTALGAVAAGTIVWNSTLLQFEYYDGSAWKYITGATHTDAHSDTPHTDSHGDSHTDLHTDGGHSDSHSDTAHADVTHVDTHSDVTHVDSSHGDAHGDAHYDGTHSDANYTDHQDAHADDHLDGHSDTHLDSHTDHYTDTYSDIPPYHSDHHDSYGDLHTDTHADTHTDYHGDTVHADHTDLPHSDSHTDTHTDSAHSDTAHTDTHSDHAHADTAHVDTHSDAVHGDTHGDVSHEDWHTDV
jgi:hypothetical protein